MKPHQRLRALSAVVGGVGVVGMGMMGMHLSGQDVEAETVLAPATRAMTHGPTTTTSSAPSFRPILTASPAAPPIDND
jgi:hypothetical protein